MDQLQLEHLGHAILGLYMMSFCTSPVHSQSTSKFWTHTGPRTQNEGALLLASIVIFFPVMIATINTYIAYTPRPAYLGLIFDLDNFHALPLYSKFSNFKFCQESIRDHWLGLGLNPKINFCGVLYSCLGSLLTSGRIQEVLNYHTRSDSQARNFAAGLEISLLNPRSVILVAHWNCTTQGQTAPHMDSEQNNGLGAE